MITVPVVIFIISFLLLIDPIQGGKSVLSLVMSLAGGISKGMKIQLMKRCWKMRIIVYRSLGLSMRLKWSLMNTVFNHSALVINFKCSV
jgi:hypothetical protein